MTSSASGFAILDGPWLARRTTMRLGGEAVAEVRAGAGADLEKLPGLLKSLGGEARVLGAGSNIIAREGQLPLVLLTLDPEAVPLETRQDGDRVLLRAGGGMPLQRLLARASQLGLAGLEGLAGVPGSVGGAFAMNAGSFGVSFGSLVRGARVFSPRLGCVDAAAGDCEFAYRSCKLKGHEDWFWAHSVTLALTPDGKAAVRARMRETFAKKLAAQPLKAHSAGCVFKNPSPEHPAGRLLEQAGMKGMRLGGMVFSPRHANFLVNEGAGTYAQAVELIELARERVLKAFGFALDLEVRLWP